ncbi:hypothetical protein PAPYR_11756 [Paratrimastix pyriformis]|uniref:Uncharacterized protein n=1 Tax=Paratrimastix pyriformis TaxID=342808 RepID=A0ABQ8U372_9EUKA|nr:hypothetical protein PAPYR_11756 [Paratrimastix pyriformis]
MATATRPATPGFDVGRTCGSTCERTLHGGPHLACTCASHCGCVCHGPTHQQAALRSLPGDFHTTYRDRHTAFPGFERSPPDARARECHLGNTGPSAQLTTENRDQFDKKNPNPSASCRPEILFGRPRAWGDDAITTHKAHYPAHDPSAFVERAARPPQNIIQTNAYPAHSTTQEHFQRPGADYYGPPDAGRPAEARSNPGLFSTEQRRRFTGEPVDRSASYKPVADHRPGEPTHWGTTMRDEHCKPDEWYYGSRQRAVPGRLHHPMSSPPDVHTHPHTQTARSLVLRTFPLLRGTSTKQEEFRNFGPEFEPVARARAPPVGAGFAGANEPLATTYQTAHGPKKHYCCPCTIIT